MKKKHLIYCLGIAALFYTCSSSSSDDVSDPDPDPNAEVTYNGNIRAVINSNCTQCHGNPTANGAPFSLTTFNSVSSRIDNIINRINRTGAGVMPPAGQMPLATRQLFQQWKDGGLLEN